MLLEPGTWVAIAIVGLIAYAIWSLSNKKWPIKIAVDAGNVVEHHGLPASKAPSILRFFDKELEFDGKLVVFVARHRNGYLQTKIVGNADAGTKQRVRNFLISEL